MRCTPVLLIIEIHEIHVTKNRNPQKLNIIFGNAIVLNCDCYLGHSKNYWLIEFVWGIWSGITKIVLNDEWMMYCITDKWIFCIAHLVNKAPVKYCYLLDRIVITLSAILTCLMPMTPELFQKICRSHHHCHHHLLPIMLVVYVNADGLLMSNEVVQPVPSLSDLTSTTALQLDSINDGLYDLCSFLYFNSAHVACSGIATDKFEGSRMLYFTYWNMLRSRISASISASRKEAAGETNSLVFD